MDEHFRSYQNPIIPPNDKTIDIALEEMWKELRLITKNSDSAKEAKEAEDCITTLSEIRTSKVVTAIFFPKFPRNDTAAIYLSGMIARFLNHTKIIDNEREIESVARISNPNSSIINIPPHQDYTLDISGRHKAKLLSIIGIETDEKVETYTISAQEIWDSLSPKSQQILSQPLFGTKPALFQNNRFPLFFEEDGRLGLTYCNFYKYDGIGETCSKNEINKALGEFFKTIDELTKTAKGVVIKEGSALMIFNNNAIHGTKIIRAPKEKTSGNRSVIITAYTNMLEKEREQNLQNQAPTR